MLRLKKRTKAEATHSTKLHLGTQEQLHCFIINIVKFTSIPQQVVDSTKKNKEKERNRKTSDTHAIK